MNCLCNIILPQKPNLISWSGLLAEIEATMNGLITNLILTILADASHPFYLASDIPSTWVETLKHALEGLTASISSQPGSNFLGWIGKLAPLLLLLLIGGLHYLFRNANSKVEKWCFYMLLAGLLITALGIAMRTRIAEISFYMAIFGLLISSVSAGIHFVLASQE